MGRLEKMVKRHERGDLPRSEWLDKLTFRKMSEIHAAETEKSNNLYLYIDLPRFDFPVIFSEPVSQCHRLSFNYADSSLARACGFNINCAVDYCGPAYSGTSALGLFNHGPIPVDYTRS